MARYTVPDRRNKPFDYKLPCDRCSWTGWLSSGLSREPQTGLLVCVPCFDKPRPKPTNVRLRERILD
jgi:hypothetical protein